MHKSQPISSITIAPDRQRKDLGDLTELKQSLSSTGLINAIVVDKDLVLIAGERRLTAARELGWSHIMTQQLEDLSEIDRERIELDENIRRLDLTWQERTNAVARYHKLCKQDAGAGWSVEKTADRIGFTPQAVYQYLDIASAIEEGDQLVIDAPTFSTARGIVERRNARKRESETEKLASLLSDKPTATAAVVTTSTDASTPEAVTATQVAENAAGWHPFLNEDFNEWAANYSGPKFNFIHCDFPYGINAGKHAQGAAKSFGGYADSEDIYWQLLQTLHNSMDNVVAESAHLMFWFSMKYYQPTIEALQAMGWDVNPWPLVWFKMDNKGILPDPKRGPRQVYEVALMASRGDRLIVRAKSNITAHQNTKEFHMSEKPKFMLQHFFEMFVDESTWMLDPTAGSGNAVIVANQLGASGVMGLERDPEFYANTLRNWKQAKEKPRVEI